MTLPSSLSIHIKMPQICRVGEKVPVTVRVENHTSNPYPTKGDEYLIVEAWDEMIKYQPGRGYPKFNIVFSEPFKLAPYESKEVKFCFKLMEPSQYRIIAKLNLVNILEVRGNPKWEKYRSTSGGYGRIGEELTISFEGGNVRFKILDIREINKIKSCMSLYDLMLLLGSIGAIIAAIAGVISILLWI